MNANDIITWLRDQAIRMPEDVHKRGMIEAAVILERLRNNLKIAVDQRNDYQEKYWAEKERSAVLEAKNASMAAEMKKAGGCGSCTSCKVDYLEEPCFSCMQDPDYPGWEWNGRREVSK